MLAAFVTAVAAPAATGCGFDDSLTRRGFIAEGDEACAQTIVRATVELEAARAKGDPVAQDAAIRSLAEGYAGAATGLGGLEVIEEDRAMRDRMVAGFDRAAAGLREAADAASAGSAQAQADAAQVLVELDPLAREIREYGFDQCGGREEDA